MHQERLVNQVAQHVFLFRRGVNLRSILVLRFVQQLVAAALELGARDNFAVDPGDNFFNHGIGDERYGDDYRDDKSE